MAEPQPSSVHEGATTGAEIDENEATSNIPKSAEDRATAAAMSSLDTRGAEEESVAPSKQLDSEALGKAMKNLNVSGGAAPAKATGGAAATAPPAEKKKAVKVDQADVTLLTEQLSLAKPKATELLKAHDGDAVRAMRAFVTAA
ncbi:hypothetical protein L228DRAFT_7186 [Xylona heveae TC161]|uniref:Nascent polypeptide-associated complex subunit alpha-like UBA domain-containing protein n=1 Tax=Xylona heveae (strain CBS 132557 / TC161) TaxID=1328760 RepID=A0A165JG09_XYLHT|nr:hypothetical protein L228DRAFT_7186 [Xylona heveae TC161]KZF26186.1 hypothetical protein L228DRAFT_7186 [Xylona heveae TC161]